MAPTEAPGGIAGTGIGLMQNGAAPPPPPEANLAYKTKGEESSGVIVMIDTLINDVEKENQVMKLEEEDAQSDYEKFMGDAKNKRAEDSKSMSDAEGSLAETNEQMVTDKGTLGNTNTELMETENLVGALVSSVQLAISMSNSGGAWDNAKKYIEKQPADSELKGKGSDIHKAAVVGDTVGDPFKDTSGPALNIVMKLMAVLSLVFADTFYAINEGQGVFKLT